MGKDTVVAYWIEAKTGELRSQSMGTHDLRGNGSLFEHEARYYADDPVDMTIIQLSRAGNDWEREAVERLKAKAAEMRREIQARRDAP